MKSYFFCFFFAYVFSNIFGYRGFMAKAWVRWPEANLNSVPPFAILFCLRGYERNSLPPPEQQGSWNLSFVRGRTNKQTLQLKTLSESRQKWRKHGKAPVLPSFKLFISEFWKVFCLEFLDYLSAKLKIKRFAPRRSWQMPNVGLITLASLFNIIRQTDRLSDIIKIWPLCSIIH